MGTAQKYYRPYAVDHKNYFEALETCQNDGATLIEFRTAEQYEVVQRMRGMDNIMLIQVEHNITSLNLYFRSPGN